MFSQSNNDNLNCSHGLFTYEELEEYLARLGGREPAIFPEMYDQSPGTVGSQSGRRGAISRAAGVPASAEAEQKVPKKIWLAEYTAMKKAQAAKEETEKK